MEKVLSPDGITTDQNRRISETIAREQSRLRQFIAKRVPDQGDAEDIFQDVFYELVDAYRLMKPVEQVGAWLFRVARNRIIDLFRSKRSAVLGNDSVSRTTMRAKRVPGKSYFRRPMPGPEAAYAPRACC